MLNWYLVHSKPRQELCSLENLERQGFECFLPLIAVEKLRRKLIVVVQEPLFPRYLFIRLDASQEGRSWNPIRSTTRVSRLVSFSQGQHPVGGHHPGFGLRRRPAHQRRALCRA